MTDEELRNNEIKKDAEKELSKLPNVNGVGLGAKLTRGRPTGELAIVVTVQKKIDKSYLSSSSLVPHEINGIRTDVLEVGQIETHQYDYPGSGVVYPRGDIWYPDPICKECFDQDYMDRRFGKYFPWNLPTENEEKVLLGGISVNPEPFHYFGTFGGLAKLSSDPDTIVGVTNYHVVRTVPWESPPPPTSYDVEIRHPDKRGDTISNRVLNWRHDTFLDAAIFELQSGLKYMSDVMEFARPVLGHHVIQSSEITNGDYVVAKRGITTGYTEGFVISANYSYLWPTRGIGPRHTGTGTGYREQTATDCILVLPMQNNKLFSWYGDSGSLYINKNNEVVGLHFAGSIGVNLLSYFRASHVLHNPESGDPWAHDPQIPGFPAQTYPFGFGCGLACSVNHLMSNMGIELCTDLAPYQVKTVL